MKFFRPRDLLSGFASEQPDPAVPELTHVGEQWAPAEWNIGWHSHPTWELYLQLDGKSEWEAGGKQYVLKPGGFFAACPGLRHRLLRPSRSHHYCFAGVDASRALPAGDPVLQEFWRSRRPLHLEEAHALEAPFRQLLREVTLDLPLRSEGIRLSLRHLVLEVYRLFHPGGQRAFVNARHRGVECARHLLETRCSERWKLADLARLSGISAHYLVEKFTAEMGVSPHRYLVRQRVRKACDLLGKSDLGITTIALECGFSSGQHFAKAFREEMGCPARDWRKQVQG